MGAPLRLTRHQVLAARRRLGGLDERLPREDTSLRTAAWAGLQDSMPRAALLSIHARVRDVGPSDWEHPSLVQVWGPRFSAYVVAAEDRAVFTLGRLPDAPRARERAQRIAVALRDHLAGATRACDEVGAALQIDPNALRYAAATGTVLIRWDGARRPLVWWVEAPDIDPADARTELARRFLHVLGPGTPATFARWAGVALRAASATWESLGRELTAVATPAGAGWILAADEPVYRRPDSEPAAARLLPSGDAYFLCHGADRELLVDDPAHRGELWTPRVWPGAVVLDGEVRGTWRRSQRDVTVRLWGPGSRRSRDAVQAEAAGLPIPGVDREIAVRWE